MIRGIRIGVVTLCDTSNVIFCDCLCNYVVTLSDCVCCCYAIFESFFFQRIYTIVYLI